MKLIIAYVQPAKEQSVVDALHRIPRLTGATFMDARGFGRGRRAEAATPEMLYGTAKRVRVEVLVRDELEAVVVAALREAAHTGQRGDGKVLVVPATRAARIATTEEDDHAA